MCHAFEDCEGYSAEVTYLRDRDGREVDFLVLLDSKPWFAVEAKSRMKPWTRLCGTFRTA